MLDLSWPGRYSEEMSAELKRFGLPQESSHMDYSRFKCGVGGRGLDSISAVQRTGMS